MSLDKLIEAVEAGEWIAPIDIFPNHATHMAAYRAYNGSLDAAKALHDALHPGVRVEIFGPVEGHPVRAPWGVTLPGIDTEFGPDLARAWLLAILKKKQAEGRG